jgi:hypothetical protein
MATRSAPVRAGRARCSSTTGSPRPSTLLPPRGHLRAGHLQRLPDVRRARRPHPRRRRLAAVHPQPLRAVRSPPVPGRGPRQPLHLFLRYGRVSRLPIAVAHGEGFADFSVPGGTKSPCCGPLRFVDASGAVATTYPGEPQRLARRAHRGDDPGRPVHRDDAAPRAGPAQRADCRGPTGRSTQESPWLRMFRNARAFVG